MKKRILSLVLAGLMVVSCAGCGESKSTDSSSEYEDLTVTSFELPTEAEESQVYVEPIDGISEDFIRGVDVSEVISLEDSGVTYKNLDGSEEDVFEILAENGVNYVRIRVWNDPYDQEGNGYGGGNCDLEKAIEMGRRATSYGMKVLIDFHYSDFWADPTRQLCPKAWEGMSLDEKETALYDFTYDSLKQLLDADVDVAMVQVGNETNFGMAGETDMDDVVSLYSKGIEAISKIETEYSKEIKSVIHYTNAGNVDQIKGLLDILKNDSVDYDVIGLSYYIYWHGTTDKIRETMEMIENDYGKEVMMAELSYPFTLEAGDATSNSISSGDLVEGYTASVQSQSTLIRDMCALTYEEGGLGVFYWGGCWVPVNSSDGNDSLLWRQYGSGWANSYASDYDPENVGSSYGGCAWENQALFDYNWQALPSLSTFKYLATGTICQEALDYIPDLELDYMVGDEVTLPDEIPVITNTRNESATLPVTWDAEKAAEIDNTVEGQYVIDGTTEDGTEVSCTVKVSYVNLATNPSFEEDDYSMWTVTSNTGTDPTDYQDNGSDAHTGSMAFHYWDTADMDFSIEQTVENLSAGTYGVKVFSQGGDFDSDSVLELYAKVNGEEVSSTAFSNNGWAVWQNPEIFDIDVPEGASLTVGVRIKCNAKAWGTLDDFSVFKM